MIYLYYLYQDDKIKYVGLTKNIKNRQRAHQKIKPPHTFVLVESFSDVSTASDAEIYHIQKNNTYQDGWNQSPGGEYKNSSGYNRKKIGGVKKGTTPWNKGKKGYKLHNEETLKKISENTQGENNPRSKITEKQAEDIIRLYLSKPSLDRVGEIMKNGIPMSYDRMFSLSFSVEYCVSPENITRIIKRKTWENVWKKIEDSHV
jgi:hypothetical protein